MVDHSTPVDDGLRTEMLARIRERGVWDRQGRVMRLDPGAAAVVIGRVADDEPLMGTERALAATAPERIIRGLATAGLLCGAHRLILAVRDDARDAWARLQTEGQGTRMELTTLPASYPMDPDSLVCDLAQLEGKSVAAAGLHRATVFDAVELNDLALALEGRLPWRRTVTVAGAVREPSTVHAPLGTSFGALVECCGGAEDPGWVPWHNGVLRGRPGGWDQVVDLNTRGVVVLPHDHPLVRHRSTPLTDLVKRVPSACVNCRVCTDVCPIHLVGASLTPHLVMRAISVWDSRDGGHDGPVLGALQCTGCGLCSVFCPTRLRPAEVIGNVGNQLAARGVSLADNPTLHTHPDRPGRRVAMNRVTEMLGVGSYGRGVNPNGSVRRLVPDRLVLPPTGPTGAERVAAVQPGQRVTAGDVVALTPSDVAEPDLRAPLNGRIDAVDPDDGIVIQVA